MASKQTSTSSCGSLTSQVSTPMKRLKKLRNRHTLTPHPWRVPLEIQIYPFVPRPFVLSTYLFVLAVLGCLHMQRPFPPLQSVHSELDSCMLHSREPVLNSKPNSRSLTALHTLSSNLLEVHANHACAPAIYSSLYSHTCMDSHLHARSTLPTLRGTSRMALAPQYMVRETAA